MRYLAVARLRRLTTLRSATPVFVIALLPPAFAAVAVSTAAPLMTGGSSVFHPLHQIVGGAAVFLNINASAAVLAWLIHTLFVSVAALSSGIVRRVRDLESTNAAADLTDSVPVGNGSRFWGEALGTFHSVMVIHICCLPLLAALAVLSPLPTIVFAVFEVVIVSLVAFGAAGSAWQSRAPRTRYAASRGARAAASVFALMFVILFLTTRAKDFRDAFADFLLGSSSMRGWQRVLETVERPALMIALLALLYAGTIAYYYVSATRERNWEIE